MPKWVVARTYTVTEYVEVEADWSSEAEEYSDRASQMWKRDDGWYFTPTFLKPLELIEVSARQW